MHLHITQHPSTLCELDEDSGTGVTDTSIHFG